MGIPENVAARKKGTNIVALAIGEAIHIEDSALESFWKPIVNIVPEKFLPRIPANPLTPMTEQEVIRFENTKVPYGEYENEFVSEVPLQYLFWLADQPDTFKALVRRYVLSDRIQLEQELEDE